MTASSQTAVQGLSVAHRERAPDDVACPEIRNQDGGDFRAFAKTIGLNERQTANAVSRVADALASSIDVGLGDSLVSDAFASGFARLVRANLDRIA